MFIGRVRLVTRHSKQANHRPRGQRLDTSLSIIIPVRNAERTIARNLQRWLELLPEIAQNFEILLVDDGSDDHTADIAQEVAREYPQIRVLQSDRRGAQQAIRTGLMQVRGAVVLIQDELGAVSGNDLKKLWELRHDAQLAAARMPPRGAYFSDELVAQLTTWGEAVKAQPCEPKAGMQLLRLAAVADSQAPAGPATADSMAPSARQNVARADGSHPAVNSRPGNGFLRHLRNLALGE